MINLRKPTHALLALFLAAFIVILCASIYMKFERDQYAIHTRDLLVKQESTLIAIAELTAKDSTDAIVSDIIRDCSNENRERFDTLLGNLAQLRTQELIEVEQLFNACGNFFAERKAVMVLRLEREFQMYRDLIGILSLVDAKVDGVTFDIATWEKLVELEKERSALSSKLVELQGQIIVSLNAGNSVASETMQQMLVEGQQTRDTLFELSAQIETVREELLEV